MKIYIDAISGEEIASDVYPEKEMFNGHIIALESKVCCLKFIDNLPILLIY